MIYVFTYLCKLKVWEALDFAGNDNFSSYGNLDFRSVAKLVFIHCGQIHMRDGIFGLEQV